MPIFKKRSASNVGVCWIGGSSREVAGYTSLLDCPEISAAVNRISGIVSTATIHELRRSASGAVRVETALSRLVDVEPWPGYGSRANWMNWIVSKMLTSSDGTAFVLPVVDQSTGEILSLLPMPGAHVVTVGQGAEWDYGVSWNGKTYHRSEILNFHAFSDLELPALGRGLRVQAAAVANSLAESGALKSSLSDPAYKPPLLVFVNSDADLFDDEKRESFRKTYLEDTERGKPWILPADLVKIEQLRPLSLTDMAIKDTVELDKKTACSIFGIPPFLLGVGAYNEKEYNNFIATVVIPLVTAIEQELTAKLLIPFDDFRNHYFRFNRRHLWCYDLKTVVDINNSLSDRGHLTGDESREAAGYSPAGLTEFRVLENYIPWDKSGDQNKLNQEANNE